MRSAGAASHWGRTKELLEPIGYLINVEGPPRIGECRRPEKRTTLFIGDQGSRLSQKLCGVLRINRNAGRCGANRTSGQIIRGNGRQDRFLGRHVCQHF
jgi:hypothetical protein